jgi:hypothetical protein
MARHSKATLLVVQGSDTWEDLAFEELEGCAASRRDVRHVASASTLFRGRNGVTTPNNGDGTLFLCKVGEDAAAMQEKK